MQHQCSTPDHEPPHRTTTSVPRVQCLGTAWSHEPTFLTIRTASPLVLECPICQLTIRVDPAEDDGDHDE